MSYRMTPARAAALRRAQLISAQKRRKFGAGYQAKNAIRQKIALSANKKTIAKGVLVAATVGAVGTAAYLGSQTPTYKYKKGMTKSTLKAYSAGKRGPALITHQNRVRPLVKKNAGMTKLYESNKRARQHYQAQARVHLKSAAHGSGGSMSEFKSNLRAYGHYTAKANLHR